MLSVSEARATLAAAASAIARVEQVPLQQAHRRYAAADIVTSQCVPPADNSAMDGYALQHREGALLQPLAISQTIAAGQKPAPLHPGTAARILTGAELPAGADCVVIQEDCIRDGEFVRPLVAPNVGDNVRRKGQDFDLGNTVVKRGQRLESTTMAALAACGISEIRCFCRPRVALFNTGSELVEPGLPLQTGEIYNSNRYLLQSLLTDWGIDVAVCETLPDDLAATQIALQQAAESCDLILTSGGVSVGDEDHVKAAIQSLGQIALWKIQVKPGKPLAFGHIRNNGGSTPIIGLPGNPVSAFITAVLFAKPFIQGLLGAPYQALNPNLATAQFSASPRSRAEFMRGQIDGQNITVFDNQSSGVIRSLTWANVIVWIEANRDIRPGDKVPYFRLDELLH